LDAEKSFSNLAIYTRFLTSILTSGSLDVHLNVLQESGALANILPKYEARSTYEKEAKALNIDFKCIEATGLPTEV